MKAPDKIFLPLFVYEKWLYQTSDTDDETEVEYIRKDKILEILKDSKHLADAALKIDEL